MRSWYNIGILLVQILFFAIHPLRAQQDLSPEILTILAEEAWESTSYLHKDISGYEHVEHIKIPFGQYHVWDIQTPPFTGTLPHHPEYALDRTYSARTGGVYRGEWYSPDAMGRIYRENGILYGHMGASMVETIHIIKKYGLKWYFSAPGISTLDTKFTSVRPEKMEEYRLLYEEAMHGLLNRIRKYEAQYAVRIINDPETMWMLAHSEVVTFFLKRLGNNRTSFNADFRRDMGFDMPLMAHPATPLEKARRSLFWRWVRSKMGDLSKLRADAFDRIVNPAGWVVSNTHGEDVVDFEKYGEVYQYPGPSARPQFSEKELVLKYWSGYIFQLWQNLTDRPLFTSARINNGVVGARSMPTPNAVQHWHNQALQSGSVGFYQWLLDYAGYVEGFGGYRGPCFGNPDNSQLGKLRWETVLKITRHLSGVKAFMPPRAKTGIFLSFDTVNIDGWKRIFSQYVELCKAQVWNGFISDSEVLNGTERLNDWNVIYVPVMDYSRREVVDALLKFVRNGGTLISCDPGIFRYDMTGRDLSGQREKLFGITVSGDKTGTQRVSLLSLHTAKDLNVEWGAKTIEVKEAEVIGTYADGSPAVTSRTVGKGTAIFFAAPLSDIYLRNDGHDEPAADGRYSFYKSIETSHGIADESWIWDITYENLHQVTGRVPVELPPVNENMILN